MAQKYKHGEKVRNWVYKWDYVPNPNYNVHMTQGADFKLYGWRDTRTEEYIYTQTNEKKYYGAPYRFRQDPVRGSYRNGGWTKYSNNKGSGKCWKREWYAARLDAKECYEEYGITFKNSSQIPFKYGYNRERGWKRTKKRKQWM